MLNDRMNDVCGMCGHRRGVHFVEMPVGLRHCEGSAHTCTCTGFVGPERAEPENDPDHAALVSYLLSAVRRKDWHAVSDAANDLRVLEASRR